MTRGRFKEARENWRIAVDALNFSDDGTPDHILLALLHVWVARWLLHWTELDFAEDVLRSIPRRLGDNDVGVQALWDLLRALRQAELGVSVFPLSVPARDWWSAAPHTDLPMTWDGQGLREWFPARIEGVDLENGIAFLVAAKRPATASADPIYFEMELTREQIGQAAFGFEWDTLQEGAFVELGFYGERIEWACIGLHRNTTWNDPRLPPLVPPPDRWYKRAVEQSWAEMSKID